MKRINHALTPGTIMVSSCHWSGGYNMTNVTFFAVISAAARSVVIREIGGEIVAVTGPLEGTVTAAPGAAVEYSHLLKAASARRLVTPMNSLRITSYAWASVWDGRPVHYNHYD